MKKIIGIAGWSGSGKTTLVEGLVTIFKNNYNLKLYLCGTNKTLLYLNIKLTRFDIKINDTLFTTKEQILYLQNSYPK